MGSSGGSDMFDGINQMSFDEWVELERTHNKEAEIRCECGVSITMGQDDHPQFHSEWCPIYKLGGIDDKSSK